MPPELSVRFHVDGADTLAEQLSDAASNVGGEVVYAVGSRLEYAPHQEFGTFRHEPQPYLRPATEAAITNWRSTFSRADSVEQAVQQIAEQIRDGAQRRAPVRTGDLRDSIKMRQVKGSGSSSGPDVIGGP